jgi:succinate dehydrogenase/fumarate reductase flavoprotein subunit
LTPLVDVVVIGGGMGGLVAAVAAQEDGARVLLVEKGRQPGGSLALSGGYVWTFPTVELYRQVVPLGDLPLGEVLVADFPTGLEWLQEHNVRLGPEQDGLGPERVGSGRRIEPDPVSGAVEPLVQAFVSAGGEVRHDSSAVGLDVDADGRVRAVRIRSEGRTTLQACGAVILATGGFQGDVELMARYVSPWSDRALLRASPQSTGDGLRMALAAGAAVSRGLNAVYGHVMPAEPARVEPAAYRALTQFYVEHCILLNRAGVRFVDESRTDAACGLALLRQPEAHGTIVFDERLHQTQVMEPFVPDAVRTDPVRAIRNQGGVVFEATTVAELAQQLADAAFPAGAVQRTIIEFDQAAAAGSDCALPVPRRANLHRCSEPPFYAVPVRAAVTFTEGGIRVNRECQALDRDGAGVPGLYVAGVDAGCISNEGYAGALAAALVTGLRAGLHAGRFARDSVAA